MIEKTDAGCNKIAQMPPTLGSRIATVMHNTHCRVKHQPALVLQAQGQIEVLKIEEKLFIEPPHRTQLSGSGEHKAAAGYKDLHLRITTAPVTQLISVQAPSK